MENILRTVFRHVLFLLLCLGVLYAGDEAGLRLSERPLRIFHEAGRAEYPTRIRWFAEDDFGLRNWIFELRERKIAIASPYELLQDGSGLVFAGIGDGLKNCRTQEVIEFTAGGNTAILLSTPADTARRLEELRKAAPGAAVSFWDAKHEIVHVKTEKGHIFLIADPFAFTNARFPGNRALWDRILRTIPAPRAIRIVQQPKYTRRARAIFFAEKKLLIKPEKEQDPAFAPGFADSNSIEYYEMTQNYFFLPEKYYLDGREITDWKTMMRVRSYDSFVPPDKANPREWHFAVADPTPRRVSETGMPPTGFRRMKIETGLSKQMPPDAVSLASIAPGSRLLHMEMRSVVVQDLKREAALRQELDKAAASMAESTQDASSTPFWSIYKIKPRNTDSAPAAPPPDTTLLQAEYDALTARNRRIGKGMPGGQVPNARVDVFRDGVNNWTAKIEPSGGPVFLVYEVAVPEIFLRRDSRPFNPALFPAGLTVQGLCRQQRQRGVMPCPVPRHEKDALFRMIGQRRFPWFNQRFSPSGNYLPRGVEQALKGEDMPVRKLFDELAGYMEHFKDTDVLMKDEFGSFHEAMLYWRAGVCRHRARLGYMLLNTIGITARCVTTREHAYLEVYLPSAEQGRGGWTYLDFGGGQGASPPEMYFELPPVSAPSPVSAPKPALLPGLGGLGSAAWLWGLPALLLLTLPLLYFAYRMIARKSGIARVSMPYSDNFMASMTVLLAEDLRHREYAAAALILLDAADGHVRSAAMPQIVQWRNDIRSSMHCSAANYRKIVDFIKRNRENGSET